MSSDAFDVQPGQVITQAPPLEITPLGKLLRDRLTPKVRLYLAGPMTGYPDLNFPAFHAAAKSLRAAGYEVVNPAELTAHGLFAVLSAKLQRRWAGWLRCSNWRQCMVIDIRELVLCDGIALLPAWEHSKGASLEYRIARGLDMQAERVEGWLNKLPADVLDAQAASSC